MDKPEITIRLDDIPENDWIKLNSHVAQTAPKPPFNRN
jgi:hypothetical protein